MNNEKYNQIIDEAYENYEKKTSQLESFVVKSIAGNRDEVNKLLKNNSTILTQEEFINKCKTDTEFSEKWGLKIEERELSLEERSVIAGSNHNEVSQNIKMFTGIDEDYTLHKNLDQQNIPTKLITITYNNETVEVYE